MDINIKISFQQNNIIISLDVEAFLREEQDCMYFKLFEFKFQKL